MAGKDGKQQTKAVRAPAPPPPQQIQRRSVVEAPDSLEAGPGGGNQWVFWMASIADSFTPWGQNYWKRDRELRDFWHTESNLASAVYTCGISNSGLEWELEGPDRTVKAVHDLLNEADGGKGFQHYVKKISTDLYTQDNGAFTEIIRSRNSRSAPIIGIQQRDAAMCQRTGDLKTPVIYTDRKGVRHKMPWYSIISHEEFPSPIEAMFNVQYCAVTRVLRSAQILRDFAIYRGEKAGGRFTEQINIIGGVKQSDIEDMQKRQEHEADNKGLVRYMFPMMIASLDPQQTPSVATIDFKSLPEGFDIDTELKWYINSLALGFGRDYQEFAPLPGRGIGSGQQSETMHMKTRGKGPKAFMDMLMHDFNFHGVMPRTVTFRYQEQDIEEEILVAKAKKTRAETRKLRLDSLEITPEIARQIAQDEGDLKPEYLEMIGEGDVTPDLPVEGGEPQEEKSLVPFDLERETGLSVLETEFNKIRSKFVEVISDMKSKREDKALEILERAVMAAEEASDAPIPIEVMLPEIKIPEQIPPDIHVYPPEQKEGDIHVHVPESPAPIVNVEVPEQNVNVNIDMPEIEETVETNIFRDGLGRISLTIAKITKRIVKR